MSYDSVLLALNPVAYWKLEELSGSVMTDSSGNGRHGQIFASSPGPPTLGIAGPIETDALSFGGYGAYGRYNPGSGTAADLRGAQTRIVWGRTDELVQMRSLLCRHGSATQNGSHYIAFNLGAITARISHSNAGVDTFNLAYSGVVAAAYYMAVVTRNTNVIRLYVNEELADEDTGFPVGDIVYSAYNNEEWTVGAVKPSGYAFFSEGVSHVALLDYALNAGQIRTLYEAAKATLPLSATITVRVVVELDTDQIDPVDFPFAHNFADALSGSPRPIVEHLSYKTNLNQSEPDYQQRINAQPYHVERTLEYAITPTSARARAMMQAALWTPGTIYKLPVCKDWGILTAQATAGASTLSLDTILRDYEIGSYVTVWEDVYEPWTAQTFEITSRTDTALGISPAVGDTLPNGSVVMPARLARLPEDSLSVDSHLIDRETVVLQFEILSTELSARRVTTYTPDEDYLDLEVFSLERAKVEWVDPVQYQISRRFQGVGTSTGNDYQRAIDTGSPQTVPIRVLLTSQEALSEFYGWMDARQGKQNPVWIVSQEADLNVTARTNTSITIDYIGYAARYNAHSARRHIAFRKTDGTYVYKMITASVDNGDGTETLSVPSAPLLTTIVKTSFLKLCTAPDQFELRYHRDGLGFIAECEFVMTELLTTPE